MVMQNLSALLEIQWSRAHNVEILLTEKAVND